MNDDKNRSIDTECGMFERLCNALTYINATINSTLDTREIMQKVMVESADAMACDSARIVLREDDLWVMRFVHNLPQEQNRVFSDEELPHATMAMIMKQPVVIEDAFNDVRANNTLMKEHGIRSVIAIPLLTKERFIGALLFNYHSDRPAFSQVEKEFGKNIALAFSIALQNARLYDESKNALERLREEKRFTDSLNEISTIVLESMKPEAILQNVMVLATKAIGAESAMLFEKLGDRWITRYVYKLSQSVIGMSFTDEEVKHAAITVKTREPLAVSDASKDDRVQHEFVQSFQIRSLLNFPLIVKNEVQGDLVFHYHSTNAAFTDAHIAFVKKLEGILSLALQSAHLFEALRESEQRFSSFMLHLPAAAWMADREGRYVYVNSEAERFFSRKTDDILGKNAFHVLPAETAELFVERDRLLLAESGRRQVLEVRIQDGSPRSAIVTKFQIPGPDGKLKFIGNMAFDITDRKKTEEELRETEWRFEFATGVANEAIWDWDLVSNIVIRNKIYQNAFGAPAENEDTVVWWKKRIHPEDVERVEEAFNRIIREGAQESFSMEYRFRLANDQWATVYDRAKVIRDEHGSPIRVIGSMLNISDRKETEERMRRAKGFSDALNAINAVMHSTLDFDTILKQVIVDAAKAIESDGSAIGLFEGDHFLVRYVYNMPEGLIGEYSKEELKGVNYAITANDTVAFNDTFNDSRVNQSLVRNYNIRSVMVAPLIFRDNPQGAIVFFCQGEPNPFSEEEIDFARKLSLSLSLALENARLYEERKKLEETMRQMAQHDPLTGLPNRLLLSEIMRVELAQSRRHGRKMALLFLDLDNFKTINDEHGHEVGDALLVEIGTRLRKTIREADSVARIGGDEFTVVLADINRRSDIRDIITKIIEVVRSPLSVKDIELRVTTSVGISVYPDDAEEMDTLLRYADMAMYQAKEQGRNAYHFYGASRGPETADFDEMLSETIQKNQLVLHYQPQFDIHSKKIVCVEALVRWNHPEKGLIEPDAFIPTAERTGFVQELDAWALKTACAQVKQWHREGLPPLCVTVNLASRCFHSPGEVELIAAILKETGLNPIYLGLEITETTAMSKIEYSISVLRKLSEMGIGISIDDFGTGYSSLNYLKKMPVKRIKIDKSFVQDVSHDPDDRTIITAVTAMAHKMNIKVVAEGVETNEQLTFLTETGCDDIQGFLFSRALPPEEFREFLAAA